MKKQTTQENSDNLYDITYNPMSKKNAAAKKIVDTTRTESSNFLMKKGDYTIHILIEEVKQLISIKKDRLPRPCIKIKCLNQTKKASKPKNDCDSYTYNEHIFFDATDLSVEILDSAKIIIEVYDSNNSSRKNFFGIQEFDLEYIYSKNNHCIQNIWVALANPESDNISKINGYLKLSISVLSTEDNKISLNPDNSSISELIVPPQIKTTYKQLKIYIFKGEEFPDMDSLLGKENKINRRCNGYVECHYVGIVKSTKVQNMNKEIIIWNEIIKIPVNQPTVSEKIVFIVKDKNKLSKDNIVGSFEISITDILNNKYNNLSIVNIYGSLKPTDNSKIGKLMNENPEIGSRWKGRIFLLIKYEDTFVPTSGVEPINDNILLQNIYKISRSKLWTLHIKLFSAYYLPTKSDKYTIKISIQEKNEIFDFKNAINGVIDWNICKRFVIETMTNNFEELPDMIIYLINKHDDIICFQRINIKNFIAKKNNSDIYTIKLFPEPCMQKVDYLFISGILKMRIKLINKEITPTDLLDVSIFRNGDESGNKKLKGIMSQLAGDEVSEGSFNRSEDLENLLPKNKKNTKTEKENKFKFYKIIACIYMTRFIIAGDSGGLSDLYAEVTIDGITKQTKVLNKCANGIWNEQLIFGDVLLNIDDQSTWPVGLITVKDKDYVSFDLLGYAYIFLPDEAFSINNVKNIRPKWKQLYLEKSNRPQGQILISFYILDEENNHLTNQINISPEMEFYNVEINALGLRELKPLNFIKVKKPYISFDLNSINVDSKNGEYFEEIKTMPNDVGPNANINSVFKFLVKLPKNQTFIPELQCNVYDKILGGLSNSSLGVFLLNVQQIIKETEISYQNEYDLTEKILKNKKFSEYKLEDSRNLILTDENNNYVNKDDIIINDKDDDKKSKDILLNTSKDKNINLVNVNNENNFLCKRPEDLNYIYKGEINNELLKQNKDDSNYFVVKPKFVIYNLPKKSKNEKENIEMYSDHLIEDVDNIPDPNLYFPLGFNRNENPLRFKENQTLNYKLISSTQKSNDNNQMNKKHYRRFYGKELESVKELDLCSPFIKRYLIRNKYTDTKINDTYLFESMKDIDKKIIKRYDSISNNNDNINTINNLDNSLIENEQEVTRNKSLTFDFKDYGYFKGLVRIAQKEKYDNHESYIKKIKNKFNNNLPPELQFLTSTEDLTKKLLIKKNVVIRIYILELNKLEKKDTFSESDPYIKILLGEKIIVNEKKNYIENSKNCKWYKYYDIYTELPGSSKITIQVFDYNTIFSDVLIGETSIDIEDRYFDNKWQSLQNKPIEIRDLHNSEGKTNQGNISLWLEIFDKNDIDKIIPWNINPESSNNLECRLIIYETEEMENLDIEDTSDIYVLSYITEKEKFSTDIHYRCQDGNASFNWRLKIPIILPRKNYDLTIQVFDKDLIGKDDYICGKNINIFNFINIVNVLDIPFKLTREYFSTFKKNNDYNFIEFLQKDEDETGEKFWIQMEKSGKKGGRVLCSLEIVPDWYAEYHPVGKGRESPNVDPYLPPPVGRVTFTMNPIKCLYRYTGPKFRKKFCKILCAILCFLYLVFVLPYVIYFIAGEVINPYNYVSVNKKKDKKEQ